ncbi:hypothetical protein F2P81_018079 [Scophthalmus maximus]|uniref:4Fe-4S ferredoxin-type domain-containing protein n=1 Tax=Scophthalmus maximus TaxID=52904 RepID=A0A6A4SDJ9_SCOMX|nr:hypothetical protein F2P81_018079 [Scophthalmus maximus]
MQSSASCDVIVVVGLMPFSLFSAYYLKAGKLNRVSQAWEGCRFLMTYPAHVARSSVRLLPPPSWRAGFHWRRTRCSGGGEKKFLLVSSPPFIGCLLRGRRPPCASVMADKNTRIAIVNHDKCKPKKCRQECKKSCPVVRMGKLCIEVTPQSKIVWISESLCIGCGICIKKCPFGALSIVNLPSNLEKETTHRYCANSFKLHRAEDPGWKTETQPGEVRCECEAQSRYCHVVCVLRYVVCAVAAVSNPPDWQEILTYFRGSELQNYFTKILEDDLRAIVKPQYVDQIPKTVKGSVGSILGRKDDTDTQTIVCKQLDLTHLRERNVEDLSGGELQRFACAVVCIQRADIFMFDEPSSYLDVKQRLKAAITIRSLITPDRYIIVVEHDLSVLDYLSDFICCLYGVPSAYGVVTMPFSVREGINIFLDGYVPTENLRFRETSLVFKVAETANEEEVKRLRHYQQQETQIQTASVKDSFMLMNYRRSRSVNMKTEQL